MDWASRGGQQFRSVEEFELRRGYWRETDNEIAALNASENSSAKFGHNALSALSPEEKQAMLGLTHTEVKGRRKLSAEDEEEAARGRELSVDTSLSLNWVSLGKVGPVKHQLWCGSCWAFSALSTQESMDMISHN